jgi:ketosteroid isomerase-like protein
MSKQVFDEIVEKTHKALKEFYKGDPEPYRNLYSTREDIALLGAQGGVSVGKNAVMEHLTTRASWFRAGENVTWESLVKFAADDLGYVIEIEHFDAEVGGSDIVSVALRATTIYRKENEEWKIIHRQGDPLVSRIDPATYVSLAKRNQGMRQ